MSKTLRFFHLDSSDEPRSAMIARNTMADTGFLLTSWMPVLPAYFARTSHYVRTSSVLRSYFERTSSSLRSYYQRTSRVLHTTCVLRACGMSVPISFAGFDDADVDHLLTMYFYDGLSYGEIVLFLKRKHKIDLTIHQLKRRLRFMGLKRRVAVSLEEVEAAVEVKRIAR